MPDAAPALAPLDAAQHLVMDGVSWAYYEQTLAEIGDGSLRVTFDRGRMEIMSPLPEHEQLKKPIARLVELMVLERDIELVGLGSTTFRDSVKAKGLEPDECYYVQNVAAVADITGEFDPAVHVPPDLAIEVEVTRKVVAREPIYAALRVPELWVVSGMGVRCKRLQAGAYVDADRSSAFPFLAPADLWPWVERLTPGRTVAVLREFQAWVRDLA
jgi:Uma2 family endonuclease